MLSRLLIRGLLAVLIGAGSSALAAGGGVRSGGGPFALAPQRPGVADTYILSFGLWGPQSVFESEAKGAARVLEARFDARGRSIVRFNGKTRSGAFSTRKRIWQSWSSPHMAARRGSGSSRAGISGFSRPPSPAPSWTGPGRGTA